MDDERPADPDVERVTREDGRYVIYFSWPDEPMPAEPPEPPIGDADE